MQINFNVYFKEEAVSTHGQRGYIYLHSAFKTRCFFFNKFGCSKGATTKILWGSTEAVALPLVYTAQHVTPFMQLN